MRPLRVHSLWWIPPRIGTGLSKHFFVQLKPREAWHVETDDDCEIMLCGTRISVDEQWSSIQSRWGPRKCPDCWIKLKESQDGG